MTWADDDKVIDIGRKELDDVLSFPVEDEGAAEVPTSYRVFPVPTLRRSETSIERTGDHKELLVRIAQESLFEMEHARANGCIESLKRITRECRVGTGEKNTLTNAPTSEGGKIRQLRKECGLTQSQLAAKVGINQTTVSRHERDLTRPGVQERKAYSDSFTRLGRPVTVAYLEGK